MTTPDEKPNNEPNPVAQIITTRTGQVGVVDAAVLCVLYLLVPQGVFWHVVVPANALLCLVGLCAYFVCVFVPGVLPQPVSLLGVPPRFFRLPVYVSPNCIALTFDDGPHPDTTPHFLDVLHAHGAKATFFLVGEQVEQFPHLAARIAREGHTIGVHGLHHRTMVTQTPHQVRRDLRQAQAIIETATGVPLTRRLVRPPYGFKTWTLLRTTARAGWTIVDWSLDVRDYKTAQNEDAVAQIVARFECGLETAKGKYRSGEIVLLHEQVPGTNGKSRPQTALAAMPELLRACERRGLRCVAL